MGNKQAKHIEKYTINKENLTIGEAKLIVQAVSNELAKYEEDGKIWADYHSYNGWWCSTASKFGDPINEPISMRKKCDCELCTLLNTNLTEEELIDKINVFVERK